MPVNLVNFPIAAVVDVLISYLQYCFTNDEITPSTYRWNANDRDSRIRISAPFVIDNEKPMSAPFLIVERGSFSFENKTIDNLKSGTENSFETKKYVDWANGTVNIICGSGVASEASSLANFLAILFQANRHGIMKNSHFIRNLNYIGIGPEVPVVKDSEVRRWEVTLTLSVSLQMGWISTLREPTLWQSAAIYVTKNPAEAYSSLGVVTQSQSTLVDMSKNFGFLESNDPRLIETEFDKGWYYIRFRGNTQLYTIIEIIDGNTVKLGTHDIDNNPVDWICQESASGVEYDLLWNHLNVHVEI
jgi:hypothetical protein